MAAADIRWVDLVLESYVVRSKLVNLLVRKAVIARLDVRQEDFNVQVGTIDVVADEERSTSLTTSCPVFGRSLLRKSPRRLGANAGGYF